MANAFQRAVVRIAGARSGREITTPIVAVADGDGLVMVGSNFGQAKDPGWLHNPRARIDGRDVRAEEVTGEERDRLLALVTGVYPGYPAYVRRAAPRRIAVTRLRSAQQG